MLSYVGETDRQFKQRDSGATTGSSDSSSSPFGRTMAAGQSSPGPRTWPGGGMRSWGSALSVGAGTRELGGRSGLVRGGLAFAGAGSNCGLGSGDPFQALEVGGATAPFPGLGGHAPTQFGQPMPRRRSEGTRRPVGKPTRLSAIVGRDFQRPRKSPRHRLQGDQLGAGRPDQRPLLGPYRLLHSQRPSQKTLSQRTGPRRFCVNLRTGAAPSLPGRRG